MVRGLGSGQLSHKEYNLIRLDQNWGEAEGTQESSISKFCQFYLLKKCFSDPRTFLCSYYYHHLLPRPLPGLSYVSEFLDAF